MTSCAVRPRLPPLESTVVVTAAAAAAHRQHGCLQYKLNGGEELDFVELVLFGGSARILAGAACLLGDCVAAAAQLLMWPPRVCLNVRPSRLLRNGPQVQNGISCRADAALRMCLQAPMWNLASSSTRRAWQCACLCWSPGMQPLLMHVQWSKNFRQASERWRGKVVPCSAIYSALCMCCHTYTLQGSSAVSRSNHSQRVHQLTGEELMCVGGAVGLAFFCFLSRVGMCSCLCRKLAALLCSAVCALVLYKEIVMEKFFSYRGTRLGDQNPELRNLSTLSLECCHGQTDSCDRYFFSPSGFSQKPKFLQELG